MLYDPWAQQIYMYVAYVCKYQGDILLVCK